MLNNIDTVPSKSMLAKTQPEPQSLSEELGMLIGKTRLVEVVVSGGRDESEAHEVADRIACSPLVKTAIHGGDPNWGRILAAAGRSGVPFNPDHAEIWLGGMKMYGPPKGASYSIALPLDERAAHRRLLEKNIPIIVDLHNGRSSQRMWTCDFTKEYVHINASYRT